MASITKSGIIITSEFNESDAMDLITSRSTMSYIPAKDTSNSCITPASIIFDYESGITSSTIFRVIASVTYSGFDTSSTAGTFGIYWQGAQHNISESSWQWAGTNYITNALNNKMNLTTLVLSSTSGTYTYDTTFSLPDSYRSTYDGSQIGIRCNYSNGVGKITLNSIIIINDKYSSSSSAKMHLSNDYIAGREFIEI